MVAWGPLAAGVAGSILAGNKRTGAGKDAERYFDRISGEWGGLDLPDLSPVELERYKNLFEAQEAGPSEFGNIQLDPETMDAQRAALSQLGELSQGGLSLQDKADLASIQGEVARQDAARQGAIMQNMAERGMGGGGMELAQRLSSQQSGADRAAADSRNVAAQAQARALQAIMDRGRLGGEMRTQQYGREADKARAMDAVAKFNAGQRQEGQRVRQEVSMGNTDLTNQQKQQQNQINQKQYQNEMDKLTGKYSNAGARAKATQKKGQAEADMIGGVISGATKGIFG